MRCGHDRTASYTSGMPETKRFSSLLAINRPVEFLDRVSGWLDQERNGDPGPHAVTPTHLDHLAAAHELAGVATCAECPAELPEVRSGVASRLSRFSHQDGGTVLAETLWVLVRHLRPERVVETGVARGISSAFTLEAMARNGTGHLWSIDLPPLGGDWESQIGIAVAAERRDRWTYIRGASRRVLPGLLRRLGSIELFTHDGLHTRKCQDFEYRAAWPRLAHGGALVSDDANFSDAFTSFAAEAGTVPVLIGEPAKDGLIGVIRRQHASSGAAAS
jgi:Methyltransferase domain